MDGARSDRWWVQGAAIFGVFTAFRIVRASLEGSKGVAFAHALDVRRVEHLVGLDRERLLQSAFNHFELVTRLWNVFYGSAHDVVAVAALVLLWRTDRERFRRWRNVAGWMLGLGLVGFAMFPTTPPRLMPASYRFVDTGVAVGGIGPVRGATESSAGNRFAAVPSLHVGRAAWVAAALLPVVRRRRFRALVAAYPGVMWLTTVVTANHWILDGAAGLAVLAVALGLEGVRGRLAQPVVPEVRHALTV
jgi:hypothetical protein